MCSWRHACALICSPIEHKVCTLCYNHILQSHNVNRKIEGAKHATCMWRDRTKLYTLVVEILIAEIQ